MGSIIAVADAGAVLRETIEYGAYGKTVYKDAVTGSTSTVSYTGNPYGYTGREPEAETGLYYYRARYYDVESGRFIQSDPIGFKGGDTNLYAYVYNSPMNFVDPTGQLITDEKLGDTSGRIPRIDVSEVEFFRKISDGHYLGTYLGEHALSYHADEYVRTGSRFSAAEAIFAALWTRDTYIATVITLAGAKGVSKPASKPGCGWVASAGMHPPHHGMGKHFEVIIRGVMKGGVPGKNKLFWMKKL